MVVKRHERHEKVRLLKVGRLRLYVGRSLFKKRSSSSVRDFESLSATLPYFSEKEHLRSRRKRLHDRLFCFPSVCDSRKAKRIGFTRSRQNFPWLKIHQALWRRRRALERFDRTEAPHTRARLVASLGRIRASGVVHARTPCPSRSSTGASPRASSPDPPRVSSVRGPTVRVRSKAACLESISRRGPTPRRPAELGRRVSPPPLRLARPRADTLPAPSHSSRDSGKIPANASFGALSDFSGVSAK